MCGRGRNADCALSRARRQRKPRQQAAEARRYGRRSPSAARPRYRGFHSRVRTCLGFPSRRMSIRGSPAPASCPPSMERSPDPRRALRIRRPRPAGPPAPMPRSTLRFDARTCSCPSISRLLLTARIGLDWRRIWLCRTSNRNSTSCRCAGSFQLHWRDRPASRKQDLFPFGRSLQVSSSPPLKQERYRQWDGCGDVSASAEVSTSSTACAAMSRRRLEARAT